MYIELVAPIARYDTERRGKRGGAGVAREQEEPPTQPKAKVQARKGRAGEVAGEGAK